MLEEDLDDTHLCIKCSATIVGLDNYIKHRKGSCGGKATRTTIVSDYEGFEYGDGNVFVKPDVETQEGKSSKNLSDPYDLPYELGADVFFSSLQLQSVQANTSGGKTTSSQHNLARKTVTSGRDDTEADWQEEGENNTDNLMKVVRDIGETKKFEQIFKPISFTHGSPEPEQSDDDEEEDEDFEEDDDEDEDYVPMPYSGGKWKPGSQPAPQSGGKWKIKGQTMPDIAQPSQKGGKWRFKTPTSKKFLQTETIVKKISKPLSMSELSEIRDKYQPKLELTPSIETSLVPQTGGKWKPESSENLEPLPSGKWKPETSEHLEPHSSSKWRSDTSEHLEPLTGGKWKPETSENSENLSSGKWKSESLKTSEAKPDLAVNKWKRPEDRGSLEEINEEGPSTSGKWKPGDKTVNVKHSSSLWIDQEQWDEDAHTHPPSDYTKGKWVPGTKVDRLEYKEEVLPLPQDFWCNICCRKLKTKTIYEKHLKSSVHLKKSEAEEQLERVSVEQMELSQQILQPPPLLLERAVSPILEPGKRRRRKTFVKCEICKHRMLKYRVGKHLISHFHYVRMKKNPAKSFGMILDNIHQIVLQSPFQCSPCRFFANTEENFLNHWNSMEHRDKTEGPGKFWCSFCQFECEDNNQMRRHLLGADHREVMLAINRSFPIIISKKVDIICPKCHRSFRFNMELRQHLLRCDSTKQTPIGTASDEYQSRFRCKLCPDEVLKSKTALQRHEKFKHNMKNYFCSICDEEFKSNEEAIKHRKTHAHRMKSAEKMLQKKNDQMKSKTAVKEDLYCSNCDHVSQSDVEAMLHQISHPDGCKKEKESEEQPLGNRTRNCNYCKLSFNTKHELKAHLNEVHPEAKHSCPLCGETFTLSQELGSHRRYKICVPSTSKNQPPISTHTQESPLNKPWKCSDCAFSSAYNSELIFHRIIHTEGVKALQTEKKLKCPLCEKSFTKHSLRHHLRLHTNEKTFLCEICKKSFSRRHNYKEHMEYVHSVGGVKIRKSGGSTDESFVCDTCGKMFRTKYSLKLHINIHTERDKKFMCPVKDCHYIGRNVSALNMHSNTHVLKTEFKCQENGCQYEGKSAYHLKRHMKNHLEPEKVYKCPECDFKAKMPAHIRRHVRVHTGECPYKCPHCDYSCGYIENLRKHILTTRKHPGKFIYQCEQCDPGSQFKTNYNNEYQVHLATAHAD